MSLTDAADPDDAFQELVELTEDLGLYEDRID